MIGIDVWENPLKTNKYFFQQSMQHMRGSAARARRIAYEGCSDASSDGWQEVKMVPLNKLRNKPTKITNSATIEQVKSKTERMNSKNRKKHYPGFASLPTPGYNVAKEDNESDISIHYQESKRDRQRNSNFSNVNAVSKVDSAAIWQDLEQNKGKYIQPEFSLPTNSAQIVAKVEAHLKIIFQLIASLKSQSHQTESRQIESHQIESRPTESHPAESHPAESHPAESHPAESRLTEIQPPAQQQRAQDEQPVVLEQPQAFNMKQEMKHQGKEGQQDDGEQEPFV